MNLPKAYIGGFTKAIKLPRMLFIIYFANFFTALILAITFKGVLSQAFGQSNLISTLLEKFDYSAFADIMYNSGESIKAVLSAVKWLVGAYFLMSIFLTGGIIHSLNQEKFSTSSFFGGAAYNFFRFLGLGLFMMLVQVLILAAVYIPLSMVLKSVSENLTTEVTLYYIAIGGFVFHLLLFLLFSMIGDYSKLYLVLNDSFNVFKGFWNGIKYVFRNFSKTYFLYLMLLFLPGVIMYVYLYLERDIKMATVAGILTVFGMQQAFMLLRVFLRTWILSSQYLIYNADLIKSVDATKLEFSVFDTKTNTQKEIAEEPVTTEKQINQLTTPEVVKQTVVEPVVQNVTETVKEVPNPPVTESSATAETSTQEYVIDFNKTFNIRDVDDEEQIITEEEMLKKVTEEESTEEGVINETDETEVENEDSNKQNIESVQQNVLDVEDESGTTKDGIKRENPNSNIIEFEL
ncbi:MAG: hypothetical protein U0W24_23855 [Bacteroidales bacterium]